MTQPNILELAKQKLQKFHWPIWFPYPSSWLRAIILVPIAFPGTRLIVFGLAGVIISFLSNSPVLLIFSTFFGLLIPTIFLAFVYHFFWFIWQKQNSYNNQLPKWMPNLISLWAGFYATVVIGLSFLLILSIFSELAFLNCKPYYEISKDLGSCAGRITGRAAKGVFYSIENNDFVDKPWFIIWIITATYLYQTEYLFRYRFIPKIKYILKNYYPKPQTFSANKTDVDLDRLRGNMGLTHMKKGKKYQFEMIPISQYDQRKPQKLNKKILIIILITLVIEGIYFFSKLSDIQKIIPFPITSKNHLQVPLETTVVTPSLGTSESPAVLDKPDNFRKAVGKAISAANLTQLAKSQDEWKTVASEWQTAIALMKIVPSSSPNYVVSQQKIIEYQRNLSYAEKNAVGRK